ncbi:ATPase [Aureococcus anophagefferens]|nr:ATPase [Aureococcus anophagefferens]
MGFCLRVAALSAGQSVASVDGKNVHFTAAEVAARAALDAIRADGRLANNKAAQQAAWEAAWIAATVELELLNNKKHLAARAAENVKRSVPPLGGRVGAFTQDTPKAVGGSSAPAWLAGDVAGSGERSAAERALANMEQERLVAAAPATAAASGNMDHFASTAGAFKGKDRDFKAAGASSGPDWLSARRRPAGGNMDHFASTAGAFKGKDRDFKATGAASGPDWLSGSAAAVAAGAAVVSPAPAAAGGNMDHFASTAGAFKGKDRDFKWDAAWAMGASSGPDWLSGSEVATAPPAKAAVGGSMSHFASTAARSRARTATSNGTPWAMGASSGPDWLSGSEVATAPPPRPRPPRGHGRPAKAAAGDSMSHFASTAGAFEGKDRDFKATGASSGPTGSRLRRRHGVPAATAAPRPRRPRGHGLRRGRGLWLDERPRVHRG